MLIVGGGVRESGTMPQSIDTDGSLIGRRLGQYRVTGLLGRGGFCTVYRAEDTVLGREVALKLLPADMVGDDRKRLEDLLAEARSAAALAHPNVVTVLHVAQEAGACFVVSELMPRGSVQGILDRQGPLSVPAANAVMLQAIRGVAAAHRSGLVHGDLKPGNLLVTADGSVKVADFGLASRWNVTDPQQRRRSVAGTPRYLAPECCQGRPASFASDVYALGMSWWAVLCGQPPYDAENATAVFRLHVTAPVPDIGQWRRDLSRPFAEVLTRCLAKDPANRFASAVELLEAFERALSASATGRPGSDAEELGALLAATRAGPEASAAPATRRISRRALSVPMVAGGGVLLALLVGVVVAIAIAAGSSSGRGSSVPAAGPAPAEGSGDPAADALAELQRVIAYAKAHPDARQKIIGRLQTLIAKYPDTPAAAEGGQYHGKLVLDASVSEVFGVEP